MIITELFSRFSKGGLQPQGPYLSFLTPRGRFRPFALCKCDSNRLEGNISTFFDRFRRNFLAEHNFV